MVRMVARGWAQILVWWMFLLVFIACASRALSQQIPVVVKNGVTMYSPALPFEQANLQACTGPGCVPPGSVSVTIGGSVASAMAALKAASPTGGDVWIPCGTYAGPPASAFFTGVHLRSSCHGIPRAQLLSLGGTIDYGASNLTTLTYSGTAGLTVASVSNIGLENIAVDMNGASAGLTLLSVSASEFHNLSLVNCGAFNCLTIEAGASSGTNSTLNHFSGRTFIQGGTNAIDFTSLAAPNVSFATENMFDDVIVAFPSASAVLFDKYCDSNVFVKLSAWYFGTAVNGVIFNSSPGTDQGVYWEKIYHYDETNGLVRDGSHFSITFNNSRSNYIATGNVSSAGGSFLSSNTWMDNGTAQNASGPSLSIPYVSVTHDLKVFGVFTVQNSHENLIPVDDDPLTKELAGFNAAANAYVWWINDDGSANFTNVAGPATAPSGTCSKSGVWVFSQDGHATFCSGTTWVSKI